jgi:hypothetical protein
MDPQDPKTQQLAQIIEAETVHMAKLGAHLCDGFGPVARDAALANLLGNLAVQVAQLGINPVGIVTDTLCRAVALLSAQSAPPQDAPRILSPDDPAVRKPS